MVAAMAVVLASTGCSTPVLYNEQRDKEGQALKKAISEVSFVGSVEDIEKKYAGLDQLEASALRNRRNLSRDFEMAAVAASRDKKSLQSVYVEPMIDVRLHVLLGETFQVSDVAVFAENAAEQQEREKRTARSLRVFNAASKLNVASCAVAQRIDRTSDLGTISAARRGSARLLLDNLLKDCQTKAFRAVEIQRQGGLISELTVERKSDEARIDAYAEQLAAYEKELTVEQSRYDGAVKEAMASNTDRLAKLSQIASRIEKGLRQLRDGAADADVAEHAEAIAKLDALNLLLNALASGDVNASQQTPETAEAVRAAMIVRLIPATMDEAERLFSEAQRPRIAPLLLAKENQRIAVEGFKKQMDQLKMRAKLREQQQAASVAEVEALSRARMALTDETLRLDLRQTLSAVVNERGENASRARFGVYSSFAYYFDEAHRARLEQESFGLRIDSLAYGIEIDKSRTAARRWESLFTHMGTVLSEYHSAGIKTSEIAEFVKGIGLFYIGHQTGK